MKSIRITFPNSEGHKLSARMDLPIGKRPSACAIFAHCFTCSKDLNAVRNISLALTQQGIAVFRFDFTGLGQSKGSFADTTFSSNVSDLEAAAAYLSEHYDPPQLLVGHSLGGAAVLMAGLRIDSIKAVATIGAPAEPVHVKHLFQEDEAKIREKGEATVSIGGRPFCIRTTFLDDLEQYVKGHLGSLKKALLVMHSPQDTIVGLKNAKMIYEAAMHPKSFITLDGADHLLTNDKDALYAGAMIASWAGRYLAYKEDEVLYTDKDVVTRTGEEGYLTEIKAGNHSLLADEPESVGGTDLGTTPYGLLSAALGACTGMTLRMYADRKKWPVKEIRVHLRHSKDYQQDSLQADHAQSKIDIFERELEVEGDLDESQRQRLLEIADKCPVHRTLHSEIEVRTVLRNS